MKNIRWAPQARLGRALSAALMAACLGLAACGGGGGGGGGGSSSPPPVTTPPTIAISTQPSDLSVAAGSAATFRVGISGNASVQWQTLSKGSWTDIAGATMAEFTLSNASLADSGRQFRALLSAPGTTPSSLTSAVAGLSVKSTFTWTVSSPSFVASSLNAVRWLDSNVAVAVGGNGAIVRTTDAGLSWAQVRESAQSAPPLRNLSVLDAKTLVATGAEGTILRSVDAGLTWSHVASPVPDDLVSTSFGNAADGIAVLNTGRLLRSSDGGKSWTLAPAPAESRTFLAVEMRGQRAVARVLEPVPGRVAVLSTDAGATWSRLDLKLPVSQGAEALGFVDDNTLHASNGYSTTRSTDGGLTWTLWSSPFRDVLHATFADARNGITRDGNYRSQDGGQTWQASSKPPAFAHNDAALSTSGVALAVGSEGQIQRSADFGGTWGAPYNSSGFDGMDLRSVVFSSDQEGLLVGGNAAQTFIARTTDGGKRWTRTQMPVSASTNVISIAFADSKTAVAAGQSLLRTKDGGLTWTELARPPRLSNAVVGFADASVGLMSDMERIFRSNDAGQTWTEVFTTPMSGQWLNTLAIRGSTVLVGGDRIMMRSVNAGLSWVAMQGFNERVSSMAWSSDKTVFAVTREGKVLRSDDAGLTWTAITTPGGSSFSTVAFSADGKLGFLAGYGNLARTSDGGQSWNLDLADRPLVWSSLAFAGPRSPVMVGKNGVVMLGSGY